MSVYLYKIQKIVHGDIKCFNDYLWEYLRKCWFNHRFLRMICEIMRDVV